MSEQVRVTIDGSRCVGSGTCVGMAPGLFRLEEGLAQPILAVVGTSVDLLDAVASCPVEAISIALAMGDALDG